METNTSWDIDQSLNRLSIVHDNRWLAIVGIPLSLFGLLVACGPWFIESARNSDDWPILAGGSVIGCGIVVAGLSLCLKFEKFIADRETNTMTRLIGLKPFQRRKQWPLDSFEVVDCSIFNMGSFGSSSSQQYRIQLVGPRNSVLLASCLDKESILLEAIRWSEFLDLPIDNSISETT